MAKDDLLDKHIAKEKFSDHEPRYLSRPIKSLLVYITWVFVAVAGTIKMLQWSSLLSSWKGVAFTSLACTQANHDHVHTTCHSNHLHP